MATKKGMDPATKERLKKYADAKKGRTTLMGLEMTAGLVAFDHVQDRDGELPRIDVDPSGRMELGQREFVPVPPRPKFYYTRGGDTPDSSRYKWAHLKHCPEWVFDEFERRWGVKRVRVRTYLGPQEGSVWVNVRLVPLAQLVAWLRFLWPKYEDFKARVEKYVVGYTDKWITTYPAEKV